MAEIIESSIHHFVDFCAVGLAGNGGGSGKDGRVRPSAAPRSSAPESTRSDHLRRSVDGLGGLLRRDCQGAGCRRGPGGTAC